MNIEKAIEVLKMENELMQFDPNTGEDYPIELQNQDNQDLYNANLVAIAALEKQEQMKEFLRNFKRRDYNDRLYLFEVDSIIETFIVSWR